MVVVRFFLPGVVVRVVETIDVFVPVIVVVRMVVVDHIRDSMDQMVGQRSAPKAQLHLQVVARTEGVGILERNKFYGIAQIHFPVVGQISPHLKDTFHVFGVPLGRVEVQGVGGFAAFQLVQYAVVLEVLVKFFGFQVDVARPGRDPGDVGARLPGAKVQDGCFSDFAPLRAIDRATFSARHQTDIQHPVAGDDVFATLEGAVEKPDTGRAIRFEKVGIEF